MEVNEVRSERGGSDIGRGSLQKWAEDLVSLAMDKRISPEGAAHLIVAEITQAKIFAREASALANTDGLTGALSRDGLKIKMDVLKERKYSVLLLDVDHFKEFNDKYGHSYGDEALKILTSATSAEIRSDVDLIVRWGGDEFVVILPEVTDPQKLKEIAERIKNSIFQTPVISKDSHSPIVGGITASIGGLVNVEGLSLDTAVNDFADKALYQAKEKRNCSFILGVDQQHVQ